MCISDMYCILWTDASNSVDDIYVCACAGTNLCASTLVQSPGLYSTSGLHSASRLYFILRTSTLRVYTLRLVGNSSAQRVIANSIRALLRHVC